MHDAPADAVGSDPNQYVTWSIRLTRDAADGYDPLVQDLGVSRAGFFEANGRFIRAVLDGSATPCLTCWAPPTSSDPRHGGGQAPESAGGAFDLAAERAFTDEGEWFEVVTREARRIDRDRRSRLGTNGG